MILLRRYHFSILLLAIVLSPMLVSLCVHTLVGASDYVSQAGLLLMTVAFPFLAPEKWRAVGFFFFVYGVWILWGIWRFTFFDILTQNDIPGMGYLVSPLPWCIIATFLFMIRRRRAFPKYKTNES